MFDSKKEKLFEIGSKQTKTSANAFINQGLKKGAETLSGNGALKYDTTGNDFLDQFANIGKYKEVRDFTLISKDSQLLYSQNKEMFIKFTLYMRTVTRKVKLIDGSETEEVQKGAGLKHESIMRFMWLYTQDKEQFIEALPLFISIGSWRDVFEMMRYDLMYHGWEGRILPWDELSSFIMAGLENPNTSELIKKYLPQLKAKSKCKTIRAQAGTVTAKWIASKLGLDYKKYRNLKSSGTAHDWQQMISKKLFDNIDFGSIHGRALMQLVSSKFIANNRLESKYEAWIESQPIAKFTGYPHELFEKYASLDSGWSGQKIVSLSNIKGYQKSTINAQFNGLVEIGKQNVDQNSGLIVVRDTSASMNSQASGSNLSAGDIAKSLALYFSKFLKGAFENTWVEFHSSATMRQWKGETIVDQWINDTSSYVGSTNFLSVIHLFGSIKNQGVEESEFPTGMLCISDGEFNNSMSNSTNFEQAKLLLSRYGFSKQFVDNFQFIFWDLRNGHYGDRNVKFESHGPTKNVFYFGGYDGSVLSFLLGKEVKDKEEQAPQTAEELFLKAMDQEILNFIKI